MSAWNCVCRIIIIIIIIISSPNPNSEEPKDCCTEIKTSLPSATGLLFYAILLTFSFCFNAEQICMCDVFYFKAENTLFCSKCSFSQSDLVLYYSSAPPPSLSEFLSSVPFVIFTPGAFCSALIFAQLFTSLGSALSPQVELHFLQKTEFFALVQREKSLRAVIQRINCLPSIWTNAYQHWQAEEFRGVGQKSNCKPFQCNMCAK